MTDLKAASLSFSGDESGDESYEMIEPELSRQQNLETKEERKKSIRELLDAVEPLIPKTVDELQQERLALKACSKTSPSDASDDVSSMTIGQLAIANDPQLWDRASAFVGSRTSEDGVSTTDAGKKFVRELPDAVEPLVARTVAELQRERLALNAATPDTQQQSEPEMRQKREKEERRKAKEEKQRKKEDGIFYLGIFFGAVIMIFALRLIRTDSSTADKTVHDPKASPFVPSSGLFWEEFPVGDDSSDKKEKSSKRDFFGFYTVIKKIRIVGVPKANGEKFAIDLVTGRKDKVIVLHFNPRFFSDKEKEGGTCTTDCVVRNHAVEKNGELQWDFDQEEISGGFPFARGQIFTLDFIRGDGHIEILVNGVHFTNFVERLKPTNSVDYDGHNAMEIQGVHVHSVSYYK